MKDRISLYPGRVTMTPVPGQENTYDMRRADQPTQVGDPLGKVTHLQDGTAALYGLGADAVPDDVLRKIPDYIYPIGSIRASAAKGIGEEWLLCNGDQIDPAQYPKLAPMLAEYQYPRKYASSANTGGECINKIAEYNGVYVAIGYTNYGGSRILVANSPEGPWTVKTVDSSISIYENDVNCLNGTWVICGKHRSEDYGYLYTTADPINGAWTRTALSGAASANKIVFDGTNYCVLDDDGKKLFMSPALAGGSWTAMQLTTGSLNYATIDFCDGKAILAFCPWAGNTRIITANSFAEISASSSYTEANISSSYGNIQIVGGRGLWFLIHYYNSKYTVCVSTDKGATWQDTTLPYIPKIFYDGLFYSVDATIRTATDPRLPDEYWEDYPTGITGDKLRCICPNNNEWVIGGADSGDKYARMYYRFTSYAVPAIAADKAYVYIKAEEVNQNA